MFSIDKNYIKEQDELIERLQKEITDLKQHISSTAAKPRETFEDTAETLDASEDLSSADVPSIDTSLFLPYWSTMRDSINCDMPYKKKLVILSVQLLNINAWFTIEPIRQLHDLISRWNYSLHQSIVQHQGIPLPFINGHFVAFFGFESNLTESCLQAIRCSFQIHKTLASLKDSYEKADQALSYHVGIHAGNVLCSMIQNDQSLDFQPFGESIILSNQLCAIAHKYHAPTTISHSVFEIVNKEIEVKYLASLLVKPIREKMRVYQPLSFQHE